MGGEPPEDITQMFERAEAERAARAHAGEVHRARAQADAEERAENNPTRKRRVATRKQRPQPKAKAQSLQSNPIYPDRTAERNRLVAEGRARKPGLKPSVFGNVRERVAAHEARAAGAGPGPSARAPPRSLREAHGAPASPERPREPSRTATPERWNHHTDDHNKNRMRKEAIDRHTENLQKMFPHAHPHAIRRAVFADYKADVGKGGELVFKHARKGRQPVPKYLSGGQ